MKATALAMFLSALAACGGGDASELTADQGTCTDLVEGACRLAGECQMAYEIGAWVPQPQPLACLHVTAAPASTAPCPGLDHDHCRARPDCSVGFWQDLGPTDGPVGDPYFKECDPELQPTP